MFVSIVPTAVFVGAFQAVGSKNTSGGYYTVQTNKDTIVDRNDFGSKWSEFGWQELDDVFAKIDCPTGDYTFGKSDGLTEDEGKFITGMFTGAIF